MVYGVAGPRGVIFLKFIFFQIFCILRYFLFYLFLIEKNIKINNIMKKIKLKTRTLKNNTILKHFFLWR